MRNIAFAFFVPASFVSTVALADDSGEHTTNVRIASDDGPVSVEARTPDSAWTVVCSGLCDQPLPLDAEYRVNAQGVAKSAPFHLLPGEDVTLTVHAHRNGRFVAGVVLVALGSVLLAASTASGILALALAEGGSYMSIPFAFAAAGGSVIGSAALVPGIVLMTHGSTTRVEQVATRAPTLMVPIISASF